MEHATASRLIETIDGLSDQMNLLVAIISEIENKEEFSLFHEDLGQVFGYLNTMMIRAIHQHPDLDPD